MIENVEYSIQKVEKDVFSQSFFMFFWFYQSFIRVDRQREKI